MFLAVFELEEFRIFVVPRLSGGWVGKLPRIPQTEDEVKEALRATLYMDEERVFAQLATLRSSSAEVINRLELTGPAVKEAYRLPRDDGGSQATLTNILGAARLKNPRKSLLLVV